MAEIGIDFTELSRDGQELEQLTRDLCDALRYRAAWSGRGADDGQDLIVQEPTSDDFGGVPRKWLVSCKDFAGSERSVNVSDVGDVPSRIEQHGCQGFLLVTTTQPSTGLIRAFEGWQANTRFLFHYWDAPRLKQLLLRESSSAVAQAYFGKTDRGLGVVGSDPTANGMANYVTLGDGRSFYFETRKEPGDPAHHVDEFELGLDHLAASLPTAEEFAVRGVWYDDKHSNYLWRVDISAGEGLVPDPTALRERLAQVLVRPGDWGGQWHDFEFRLVSPEALGPKTPRVEDEANLQLFAMWPDEPPKEYGPG